MLPTRPSCSGHACLKKTWVPTTPSVIRTFLPSLIIVIIIIVMACLMDGMFGWIGVRWDFGDGIVPLPLDPRNQVMSHTFNSTGTFNITLRAVISSATVEDREVFFKQYVVTSTPQPGGNDDDGLSGGTIAGIGKSSKRS